MVATSGGSLPCKKVIHAVGPIYSQKGYECPYQYKLSLNNSFKLCKIMKLKTVALPALCTGLYKFPTSLAAQILFEEILHYNHHDLN